MAEGEFKQEGKPRPKNPDEKYYNRGRMLCLRVDKKWDADLKEANHGKVGAPFQYAESLIMHLALIRSLCNLPLRQVSGLAESMFGAAYAPRRSQLHARLQQVQIDICAGSVSLKSGSTKIRLAADSSGLKQHNNGSWITKKWKVKRGFVKLHILIDVDTKKILGLRITDETVGDTTVFRDLLSEALEVIGPVPETPLDGEIEEKESIKMIRTFAKDAVKDAVREASGESEADGYERAVEKIAKGAVSDIKYEPPIVAYADAAYGSRDNIKAVKDAGLESGIALKRNCVTGGKGRGDSWNEAVRDQLGAGEKYVAKIHTVDKEANRDEWKKMNAYDLRWIVEIVFAAFKNIFGDSVRSLTRQTIIQEVRLKVSIYNQLIDLEAAMA